MIVISSIMASALISGIAMADNSSLTQIQFNNNGAAPANLEINGQLWTVPNGGKATPNTKSSQFTITFNPGIAGQKKFYCTVRTDSGWLDGTTAYVEFNNNVNMFQTNNSTNNPNNDSQPLIENSGQAVAPSQANGGAGCAVAN